MRQSELGTISGYLIVKIFSLGIRKLLWLSLKFLKKSYCFRETYESFSKEMTSK